MGIIHIHNWEIESKNLTNLFEQRVKPLLVNKEIHHLSIFAIAPQPLLILLGSLLTGKFQDRFRISNEAQLNQICHIRHV